MTFLLENWMLFVVALTSGGLLLWPMLGQGGGAAGVSPQEAVQLMNKDKAVVVDICSGAEFEQGHVAGAKHVPLDQLQDKLAATVKNKQQPLILVCASGLRSKRAVAVAHQLGYDKVYSLTGGLAAWRAANLPVNKG